MKDIRYLLLLHVFAGEKMLAFTGYMGPTTGEITCGELSRELQKLELQKEKLVLTFPENDGGSLYWSLANQLTFTKKDIDGVWHTLVDDTTFVKCMVTKIPRTMHHQNPAAFLRYTGKYSVMLQPNTFDALLHFSIKNLNGVHIHDDRITVENGTINQIGSRMQFHNLDNIPFNIDSMYIKNITNEEVVLWEEEEK